MTKNFITKFLTITVWVSSLVSSMGAFATVGAGKDLSPGAGLCDSGMSYMELDKQRGSFHPDDPRRKILDAQREICFGSQEPAPEKQVDLWLLIQTTIQSLTPDADKLTVARALTDLMIEVDLQKPSLHPGTEARVQLDHLRSKLDQIQLQLLRGSISPEQAKSAALGHGVER